MLYFVVTSLSTLVVMMFMPVMSLMCHEGFNFTVGRIPFYFWAEHQCDATDICVIQEYAYDSAKPYSEIAVRFGGCATIGVKEFFKCRIARGESLLTMNVAKVIFQGLEKKLNLFATDITANKMKFWSKCMSRGKDISEFIVGVIQFLSSIGFDGDRFKMPLYDFAIDVMKRDVPKAMISGYTLLKALKSDSYASKRLSMTLRQYAKVYHDNKKPSIVSQAIMDAIPRVMHPIVTHTTPNLDGSFNEISDVIELGFTEMSEENFSLLLLYLTITESVMTVIKPDERYFVTEAFKNIVTTHMPTSSSVDLETHIFDTLNSFLMKTSSKCTQHNATCIQRRIRAHVELQTLAFEYRRRASTVKPSQTDRFFDSVYQLALAYSVALSQTMEYSAPISAKQYDTIFPKIEVQLEKVIDILNDPNEDLILGWSCLHHHCSSNLCNSHYHLVKTGSGHHASKTEL